MLKQQIKTIEKVVPAVAFVAFIAMILACSSNKNVTTTGDSNEDAAMISDTISAPLPDYAMN